MAIEEISYFKGKTCEVLICSGLVLYIIGLLSLTTFGSPIFILCSYIGTIPFLGGFLAKFGLLTTKLRSKNGIAVILLFTSALLFVTAVNSLFIDITMKYKITHFAFVPNASKLCVTLIRPYAYLSQPLIGVGATLFILAILLMYSGNTL